MAGGFYRIDRDAQGRGRDLHFGGRFAGDEGFLFLAAFLADDRILEALHAVGAFFHHAAHADGDVRVLLEVVRIADRFLAEGAVVEVVGDERVALVVIEEIEAAGLIGAVVRAVAGADAAVVGHRVESVFGVDCGVDWADHFAGGRFAMDAGDRLRNECRIVGIEIVVFLRGEIAIHADPVHFAAAGDLILTDDRDVVLRLACDEAGVAAHAGREVDRHAPLVERVVDQCLAFAVFRLVEIDIWRGVRVVALLFDVGELLLEAAFVVVRIDRGNLAGEGASVHRAVLLRDGDRVAFAGDGDAGAGGEVARGCVAERVGIHAAVDADEADMRGVAGAAAELVVLVGALAVTERDDDRVFRLTERDHHRDLDAAAVDGDRNDRVLAVVGFAIGADIGVFAFDAENLGDWFGADDDVVDTKLLGGFWRDESGVIPGDF